MSNPMRHQVNAEMKQFYKQHEKDLAFRDSMCRARAQRLAEASDRYREGWDRVFGGPVLGDEYVEEQEGRK